MSREFQEGSQGDQRQAFARVQKKNSAMPPWPRPSTVNPNHAYPQVAQRCPEPAGPSLGPPAPRAYTGGLKRTRSPQCTRSLSKFY